MRPKCFAEPEFFIHRQNGKADLPGTLHVFFAFTLAEFPDDKLTGSGRHNGCKKGNVRQSFRCYCGDDSYFLCGFKSLDICFGKTVYGHDLFLFVIFSILKLMSFVLPSLCCLNPALVLSLRPSRQSKESPHFLRLYRVLPSVLFPAIPSGRRANQFTAFCTCRGIDC